MVKEAVHALESRTHVILLESFSSICKTKLILGTVCTTVNGYYGMQVSTERSLLIKCNVAPSDGNEEREVVRRAVAENQYHHMDCCQD